MLVGVSVELPIILFVSCKRQESILVGMPNIGDGLSRLNSGYELE